MNPFFQDSFEAIYCGDCRSMAEVADGGVQCVVTSPPYWALRKYEGQQELIWGPSDCNHQWQPDTTKHGNLRFRGEHSIVSNERSRDIHPVDSWKDCEHQWDIPTPPRRSRKTTDVKNPSDKEATNPGSHYASKWTETCSLCGAWKGAFGLEPTPEMYVQHTIEILREIRRVLRKDGVVFWNIGDSYAGGKGTCFNPGGGKGSFSTHGDRKDAGAYPLDRGNVSILKASGLKPKDLCLIPFHIAIAARADGWWVRSVIIWNKDNPMPESVEDRPTNSYEFILMLAKSGKAQFWTHRDLLGTRKKPKPDYRWVKVVPTVRGLKTKGNQELGRPEQRHGLDIEPNRLIEETAIEPPDWKVKIECPDCDGTGNVDKEIGWYILEDKCPTCNGKGKTTLWKRINLWHGHDYYWDADAVREPQTGGAHSRGTEKGNEAYQEARGSYKGFRSPITELVAGRNLRDVWEFPTQSYSKAHFAVFPEKLPELCIKAATSEKGCCPKCGAPWVRVLDKKSSQFNIRVRDARAGRATAEEGYKATKEEIARYPGNHPDMGYRQTVGWRPTCDCGLEPVPCTALDPFMGTGMTLWVAKKMGRRAIGYDISEAYCKLAVERNRQMALELK